MHIYLKGKPAIGDSPPVEGRRGCQMSRGFLKETTKNAAWSLAKSAGEASHVGPFIKGKNAKKGNRGKGSEKSGSFAEEGGRARPA